MFGHYSRSALDWPISFRFHCFSQIHLYTVQSRGEEPGVPPSCNITDFPAMWHRFSDTKLNFNPDLSLQFRSPTGQTKPRSCVGPTTWGVLLVARTIVLVTVWNTTPWLISRCSCCFCIYEPFLNQEDQPGPLFERRSSFWVLLPFIVKRRGLAKSYWLLYTGLSKNRLSYSRFVGSDRNLYVPANDSRDTKPVLSR